MNIKLAEEILEQGSLHGKDWKLKKETGIYRVLRLGQMYVIGCEQDKFISLQNWHWEDF
jgi:hypothetical protein